MIVGAVDAVLGSVVEIGELMVLGLIVSGIGIGYRWWLMRKIETRKKISDNQLYLPPPSNRSPLPNLDNFPRSPR